MKIGLYGIYGTYNFGCEAIVRGAYQFVKKKYPGCEVIYFSYSGEYDRKILKDLDIDIVDVKYTKSISRKLCNRVVSAINPNRQLLMINYKELIDLVDIIVSIGGDIYTIPEVFREQKKYNYYNTLVNFCNKAIEYGKEVIVYGASVGPWGHYRPAVEYYSKNMKKYKSILCREERSVAYLKSLDFANVHFLPDPAFLVRDMGQTNIAKKYIGINMSPLSFYENYGDLDVKRITKIALKFDQIIDEFNYDLLLIPHVISSDEKDDDCRFLKKIWELMEHKDRATLAEYENGFLGIKQQLRECHVVVAARMHCAINAIVENVPTIFVSYSQKSRGMCEYIYGNQDYVIGLKDFDDMVIDEISRILSTEQDTVDYLSMRNKSILLQYEEMINCYA